MLPLLLLAGAGALLIGCASSPPARETFPDHPKPEDPLTKDPCSVKQEPDIVFHDAAKVSHAWQKFTLQRIKADLAVIQQVNPKFLCGLERIELWDMEDYQKTRKNPDVAAHYNSLERSIWMGSYHRDVLFHEIGHHVHNLGLAAPLMRDLRSLSWRQNAAGDWQPLGINALLTPYSKTSYLEDWAETFSVAAAYPMEVGLFSYAAPPISLDPIAASASSILGASDDALVTDWLNPGYRERTFNKFEKVYSGISFPRVPIQEVKIEVGPIQTLPLSNQQWSGEKGAFFLDQAGGKWFEWSPALGVPQPRPQIPTITTFSPETLQGLQMGKRVLLNARSGYFSPSNDGPGTGFILADLTTGETSTVMPLENAGILGEFFQRDGGVEYFSRGTGTLVHKRFDLYTKKIQTLGETLLPEGFTPLHVMRREGSSGFFLLGKNLGRDEIQIFEGEAGGPGAKGFKLTAGGAINFPSWREDSMLPPVQLENGWLFPLKTFQFIFYDFKEKKFSLLQPTYAGDIKAFKSLQGVFRIEGKLYCSGKSRFWGTEVASLQVQFP